MGLRDGCGCGGLDDVFLVCVVVLWCGDRELRWTV